MGATPRTSNYNLINRHYIPRPSIEKLQHLVDIINKKCWFCIPPRIKIRYLFFTFFIPISDFSLRIFLLWILIFDWGEVHFFPYLLEPRKLHVVACLLLCTYYSGVPIVWLFRKQDNLHVINNRNIYHSLNHSQPWRCLPLTLCMCLYAFLLSRLYCLIKYLHKLPDQELDVVWKG